MKNKITKTIIAIVFVMFLKINNVYADDIVTKCLYIVDSEETINIEIKASGSINVKKNGKDTTKYDVINWSRGNIGINGYTYYKDNNQKCPPKMLYADYRTATSLYFSDTNQQNIEECENDADLSTFEICWGFGLFACDDGLTKKWVDLTSQQDFKLPTHDDGEDTPADGEEQEEVHYDDPEVTLVVTPYDPNLVTYSCGNEFMTGIPNKIPKIGKFIYNFLMFLVPISVIILGSVDLIKAVTGGKEDEIKKGQQTFVKRLIAGLIVFFAFAIVKFIVSIVAFNSTTVISCIDCLLRSNGSCVMER